MRRQYYFTLLKGAMVMVLILATSMFHVSAQEGTPAATPTFEILPADDEMLEVAQEIAITDVQKQVLEDGVVTDDELRESIQDYLQCVHDAGFSVTFVSEGIIGQGYSLIGAAQGPVPVTPGVESTPDMTDHNAELECYRTTRLPIEGVYMGQTVVSDQSSEELLTGCLETSGLIEPGAPNADDVTTDLDLHDTDTVICMAYPHYRGGSLDLDRPMATPEA